MGRRTGKRSAIAGLGGLGHMGVKIAAAMGAEVTVLQHFAGKGSRRTKTRRSTISSTQRRDATKSAAGSFDLILDTISAQHDYNAYLIAART